MAASFDIDPHDPNGPYHRSKDDPEHESPPDDASGPAAPAAFGGRPHRFVRRLIGRVEERLADRDTRAITIGLLATCVVLLAGLVYWIVLLTELPSTVDLRRSRFEQATVVYSQDGEVLTSYQDKNRRWVPLDEISPHVVDALIATEDRRFYRHHGIDVRRTIAAGFKTLAGDLQGGSTITMQFARNAFPDIYDDATITRKIKEWITALRVERMYTKDEILEMYLNTVPFMYNAFGIEAAARTYFQTSAASLNERGAATLVGMLKGTVYYNPVRHPERSLARRNFVLQEMMDYGALDSSRYQEIVQTPTRLNFKPLTPAGSLAPHFAEYLRKWLDEWAEQHSYNLYTDGLRVYTTIDAGLQKIAQEAVDDVTQQLQAVVDVEWSRPSPPYFSSNASSYGRYRAGVAPFAYFWKTHGAFLDDAIGQSGRFRRLTDSGVRDDVALDSLRGDAAFVDSLRTVYQRLQAGFIAIDPRDGEVKAWVGGSDFGEVQYDHVGQSRRQPGSTFKPFVYATALSQGFSPNSYLRDEPVEFVDPDTHRRWRPENAGTVTGKLFMLRDGLAYSKNTITSKLVMKVGPRRIVEYAHRMGIQSDLNAVPSIGLGTSEVSLLELAGAYTTLAMNGRYREPVIVTRIEDEHGRVLAQFSHPSRQAIPADIAYNVLDMMRGVVDYGTGVRIRHAYGVRGDVAGKTGTTQNGADGWFMLLHPHLVMGAWVGFDAPAISFRTNYWGQGAHTALPIVGTFVRRARRASDDLSAGVAFQPPPGYRPPSPPSDTLQYANLYLDSLRAGSDTLYRAYGLDSSYTADSLPVNDTLATTTTADSFRTRDAGATRDKLSRDTSKALSTTDSLNRAERIKGKKRFDRWRRNRRQGRRGNRKGSDEDTTRAERDTSSLHGR